MYVYVIVLHINSQKSALCEYMYCFCCISMHIVFVYKVGGTGACTNETKAVHIYYALTKHTVLSKACQTHSRI